jgi:hypothetical protein
LNSLALPARKLTSKQHLSYPAAGGNVDSEDEIIKKSVINEISWRKSAIRGLAHPPNFALSL